MRRNPALAIARVILQPWCMGLLIASALLWGAWGYFFGTDGDLHRMKLSVYIDGAAPNHRFDAGSDHAGVVLSGLNLKGSYFPKVRLAKARLNDAPLGKAVFEGCDLTGAVGMPLANLRTAVNWHTAIYDEGAAKTIAESFQRAGVAIPAFPSWDCVVPTSLRALTAALAQCRRICATGAHTEPLTPRLAAS